MQEPNLPGPGAVPQGRGVLTFHHSLTISISLAQTLLNLAILAKDRPTGHEREELLVMLAAVVPCQ